MDNKIPTDVAAILKESRKTITNEDTGNTFEIRKLTPIDFLGAGLLPMGDVTEMIALADKSEEEIADKLEESVKNTSEENVMSFYTLILKHGVTSFKVVTDGASVPDEGIIHYADLPTSDSTFLVTEIIKFSGVALAAWGVKPNSFR